MGLEDNQQREQETRVTVSEERLKLVLYAFKDDLRTEFATKRDVRWLVFTALLGGPMIASLLTAAVTRQTPPQQVDSLARLLLALF